MPNFRSNRYYNTIYIQPTPNEVGLSDIYTQPGHGLEPGTAVYLDSASGNLLPAIASSLTRSTVLGIVQSVNGNDVTVVYQGEVTFPAGATSNVTSFPLLTGNTYYLSASVTGGITAGYNTTVSSIIKPLLIPVSGYQGVIVNSLPLSSAPLVSLFTPVGSIVPYTGGGSNLPEGWLLCAGDALSKASQDPPYSTLYDIIGEKYGVLGVSVSSTTGNTAYIRFDGSVDDPPASGPGSTKNHSIENNDVFKMIWGSNETVVQAYSATGTTHNVTFKYLAAVTGSTSFNSLGDGTEITLKALVNGEAAGYTSDKFFIPDLRGRVAIGAGKGRGLSSRNVGVFGGEETHTLTNAELPSHSHNIQLLNSEGISGTASYLLSITGGVGTVQATLSSFPQGQPVVSSATGGAEDHENMSPFLTTNWIIRYRSSAGQAGIEVGPQGKAGVTGAQGIQGVTGSRGATGGTGYALGAMHYTYTTVTNVPPGYFNPFVTTGVVDTSSGTPVVTFTPNIVISANEYYGAEVGNYIVASMSNNNSQRQALAIVRSMRDPSGFFGVYALKNPYTVVSLTGPDAVPAPSTDTPPPAAQYDPAAGISYYRLPIKATLAASGNYVAGEMYSIILVPSASDGSPGAKGATGARGATGESVNAGLLTYYYAGDQLLDLGASGQPGDKGILSYYTNGSWFFTNKDYFGNDASSLFETIGQANLYQTSSGITGTRQRNGVQMTIRSLSETGSRYLQTFYLSGNYVKNTTSPGGTAYYMLEGNPGSTASGSAGGLLPGTLYGISLNPMAIKDGTGYKQDGSETTIVITDDTGVDVDSAVADDDSTVISELAASDPLTYQYPYGASKDIAEPTSGPSLFNAMEGSYSSRRFNSLSTSPVWAQLSVKNSFNYNLSLTSQPCGGNCQGGSGYIALCDIVRDPDVGNYYTAPRATNILLAKTSANTVIDSNVTQVVDGCSVNIYGGTGAYFSKVPVGISANYMNTGGETGRNTLVVDVYMNTNNVVAGNYIGIRPEYFNLALTADATGHQSLAGIYKVDSVSTDKVRVHTSVPFGASGSSVFTGYITGGISGDFNRVDVYTVSVNFKDCSGYIVNSGELTLGLSSYGLPFVVSFEGTTSDSQTAKAISVINSGFVEVGENVAFYGWPAYGAALYAASSGNLKADNPIVSKCGHAVVAKDGGVIDIANPILTANTYGMYSRSGGSIHVMNFGNSPSFTTVVNNAVMGVLDSGIIEIEDSRANLMSNRFQSGFYFGGNSSFFAGAGPESAGLTGATGLSSIFTSSTGGATGTSGNTGGSSFFIPSPDSAGEAELTYGFGVVGVSQTGNSSLRASTKNTTSGVNRQIYTSPIVAGAKAPNFGFPRIGVVNPPIEGNY
jgi:microcystin-dependent protein